MDSTHRLPAVIQFYRRQQRMPSLGELQHLCGFKSRTAAEKVAGRLVTLGLLATDKTGRLLPIPCLLDGARRSYLVFPSRLILTFLTLTLACSV